MVKEELQRLLYQALHSDIGIVVRCSPSFALVRQKLYAVRRELNDPALANLSFVEGPDDELWILKTKETPDGEG